MMPRIIVFLGCALLLGAGGQYHGGRRAVPLSEGAEKEWRELRRLVNDVRARAESLLEDREVMQ